MLIIMNVLKNLLFALIIIVGTSVVGSAQKKGDQTPPKKDKPPIVKPGDKPKDKPKKPENEASVAVGVIGRIYI